MTLETLILEGDKTKINITFDYPTSNGPVPVNAIIKPINSIDWNNMVQLHGKDVNGFNMAILGMGLYSEEDEQIPEELLCKMPIGVVEDLLNQIMVISGVQQDKEEQRRVARELLGF